MICEMRAAFKDYVYLPWAPKTMKNRGFGHLKTRLFTIKTSKNVGFGGPWYVYRWSSWYDICYCRERESGEVDSLTEAPFPCVMNIMTRDVFPGQGSLSSRSKCKPGMSKLIPSLWPYPRPVWLPKHTTVLFWRPKSTAFFQPWGDHRYPLWRGVVSHVGRSDSWLVTWEVLALQSLFYNSKAVGNGPASCFWNQNLVFMIVLWWRSSCGHHFRIDTKVLSKVLSSFWGSIPVATKHRNFASNWPLHLQLLSWPFPSLMREMIHPHF